MDQRQLNGVTRQRLLRAALQRFAHAGYAATSVRQIVDTARLTKPVLYYYSTSVSAISSSSTA